MPSADGQNCLIRVFVGGAIQTGSIYAHEAAAPVGNSVSNAESYMRLNVGTIGNATGEGITSILTFQNVNSTSAPFCFTGSSTHSSIDAAHNSQTSAGSLLVANASSVVNGLRIYFNGGNIAAGRVKLFGLK